MTHRYQPRAWGTSTDWDYMRSRPSETVYAEDRTPQRTGLLDQHGVPIYRVPETVQFGFQPRAQAASK